MNNPGLFQAKWNLGGWAFCNLAAIGLLGFWLWPTGQMLCVIFDEWLFHLLNDPLASNSTWLHVWAVASLRPFDAVVGVVLLMLLIRGDWVFKTVQVRQAMLGFVGILLALGWGYYTPFAAKVSGGLLRVTVPVFELIGKLPLLGRLSVMRAAA